MIGVWGLRLRVWGLGFGVWGVSFEGIGFGVWNMSSGLSFGILGLGCGQWDVGCGVWRLGLNVWGLGLGSEVWVVGFGVWVLSFGFGGLGIGVWDAGSTAHYSPYPAPQTLGGKWGSAVWGVPRIRTTVPMNSVVSLLYSSRTRCRTRRGFEVWGVLPTPHGWVVPCKRTGGG